MCDGPGCAVGRTLRCFRLGWFSGSLRHCQRDHRPLQRVAPGEDGSLQSELPSRPCKYSKSGDLLCTGGNPAHGLLPLPIQSRVSARCLESLRLQFRRAVHVRTMCAVPEGLVYQSDCVIQLLPLHNQLDGYPYDLMIELVGDWCFASTFHAGGWNYGSGSSYYNSSASVIGLVLNSNCCAGHSTLVDRTL